MVREESFSSPVSSLKLRQDDTSSDKKNSSSKKDHALAGSPIHPNSAAAKHSAPSSLTTSKIQYIVTPSPYQQQSRILHSQQQHYHHYNLSPSPNSVPPPPPPRPHTGGYNYAPPVPLPPPHYSSYPSPAHYNYHHDYSEYPNGNSTPYSATVGCTCKKSR